MLSCLFVYIFHTVPEKVQNLDANFVSAVSEFNTTTQQWTIDISITWSAPLFPNGVITSYNVTVYRTDNTSDVEYSNASITVPNVTVSVTVPAYTNYTVSVAASTSVGQGPEESVIIQSPEAGIHDYSNPAMFTMYSATPLLPFPTPSTTLACISAS